ncbi:PREDICTED: chelonianin-like [Gekko japonicus]|uniref:Chelonianin-like n=1 Tax=Gekko japonicus TaxID=146911 RepID=A0ABM1JPE8_GEKJA|nr:PREDICTED: chelonianin-like [Gekko japonicus]
MAPRILSLLLLVGLLSIWAGMPTATEAQVHPGRCPKPTGGGVCADMCKRDSDCRADEKCCFNGCGRNCMKAIRGSPRV